MCCECGGAARQRGAGSVLQGGRGGDTDVEGLQEGHPDLPTTTVSMERQE